MRKFVCAGIVTVVAISISVAADYNGTVVEVSKDGKSITILTGKKKGQEGKKISLKVADNVVVKTGKVTFDKAAKKVSVEEGEAITGGLTSASFSEEKIKEGVNVRVTTEGEGDAEKVTKVIVTAGKKKKGAGN